MFFSSLSNNKKPTNPHIFNSRQSLYSRCLQNLDTSTTADFRVNYPFKVTLLGKIYVHRDRLFSSVKRSLQAGGTLYICFVSILYIWRIPSLKPSLLRPYKDTYLRNSMVALSAPRDVTTQPVKVCSRGGACPQIHRHTRTN